MQFNFTETDESREGYEFGGRLEIKAENALEVSKLIDHFRLFRGDTVEALQARITALQSDSLSYVEGTEKRPMYAVETSLAWDYSKPYAEWMEKNLGYVGTLPDLDIPRQWDGLKHTNYQAELRLQGEHICFLTYVSSEPWAGKDAQTYAERRAVDYIEEEFGERYHEPEFIQAGNANFMKRNPNYLKRRRPTPAASNARLKRALFTWWLDTQANEEQRAIVEGNRQIVAETGSYMDAFAFERPDPQIYYGCKVDPETGKTSDYKSMSFADFAKLGAEESPDA